MNLSIHSIYTATEGEGIFVGTPQIFVRFQGCNVGCLNCDSKETWDFDSVPAETLSSVIEKVETLSGNYPHQLKRVSITGGDPLHPKHVPGCIMLAKELKSRGFYLNIEAAGTRVVHEIFDYLDFISFDLKTPSTGVQTDEKLILKLHEQYPNRFQIKAVCYDKKDFEYIFNVYENIQAKTDYAISNWCVTPCYNTEEEFPKERFDSIIKMNESFGGPFRVIGQQHKWLHGADKKNI